MGTTAVSVHILMEPFFSTWRSLWKVNTFFLIFPHSYIPLFGHFFLWQCVRWLWCYNCILQSFIESFIIIIICLLDLHFLLLWFADSIEQNIVSLSDSFLHKLSKYQICTRYFWLRSFYYVLEAADTNSSTPMTIPWVWISVTIVLIITGVILGFVLRKKVTDEKL